jgi:hypothetical protein
MKQLVLIGIVFLASCTTPELIGTVNQISTRNIDSKTNYGLIKSYVAYDNSQLRDLKGTTIQEAIDNTVKSVPGGEYLMNVKIYKIGSDFSVQGDVWGVAGVQASYFGFQVGDKVSAKDGGKWYTGVIVSLKDSKSCLVKWDDNGKIDEEKYTDITKNQVDIGQQTSYYGFHVGDKVTTQDNGKWYTGAITALKDDKTCLVKWDDDGTTEEMKYTKLTKVSK